MKRILALAISLLTTSLFAVSITIQWDAVPGVTQYRIYQSDGNTNAFVLKGTINTNRATLSGYGDGAFYFYVTSYISGGGTNASFESVPSNFAVATIPKPPTNLIIAP
jgi:hypothetical protein